MGKPKMDTLLSVSHPLPIHRSLYARFGLEDRPLSPHPISIQYSLDIKASMVSSRKTYNRRKNLSDLPGFSLF
ncbi:hypothetical protein NMY22_g9887 [Coprinellus aureogranulatus]|nr:hypothetical protein NMY22_g9887 [Coprinellus aureogranulatus]